MCNQFKPGDKIVNKYDEIWIVTHANDNSLSGVVLYHHNYAEIGTARISFPDSTIAWRSLEGPFTMYNPPSLNVGDLVEAIIDGTGLQMIIQHERAGDVFACVDLETGQYHLVDGVHLTKINSVTLQRDA